MNDVKSRLSLLRSKLITIWKPLKRRRRCRFYRPFTRPRKSQVIGVHPAIVWPGRLSIQLEPPEATPPEKRELGQFSMRYVVKYGRDTPNHNISNIMLLKGFEHVP
jgi:hypothetical protein